MTWYGHSIGHREARLKSVRRKGIKYRLREGLPPYRKQLLGYKNGKVVEIKNFAFINGEWVEGKTIKIRGIKKYL